MSGRFVDMDVVEANPYTMYVGVFDRRHLSHHRQRRHVGAGVRARSGALDRRRGDLSTGSEHHLGGHRRARESAERELGRRHLQEHRRRQDLDQRRPQDLDAHRAHRHSPVESGDRLRGGAGIGVGSRRRSRAVSDDGRRQDVATHAACGRRHRRHRCRDGLARSQCVVCRVVSAATHARSASTAAVPAARSGRARTQAPPGRS